jgi:hypothetical protein
VKLPLVPLVAFAGRVPLVPLRAGWVPLVTLAGLVALVPFKG